MEPANDTDHQVDTLTQRRAALDAQVDATTLTIRDTCTVLGISRRTYYRLLGDGRFNPRIVKGRPRIPRDQVALYLDELNASVERHPANTGHPAA